VPAAKSIVTFIICSPLDDVLPGVELNLKLPPRQRSSYDCCMGIEGLSDASSFDEISSLAARTVASSESVNASGKIFIMYSVVANQTPLRRAIN